MRRLWQDAMRNFGSIGIIFILLTVGGWLIFMILVPQLIMLDFSFRPLLPLRKLGGPEDVYTLKNYIILFSTPLHRAIFIKTIWSSVIVTFVARPCYPISFYLAKVARGARFGWIMMGSIVPYWINELLRIFAGPDLLVLLES